MTSPRVPARWARLQRAVTVLVLVGVSPAAEELVAREPVDGGAAWGARGADIPPRRLFTTRELFDDEEVIAAVETIAAAEVLPVDCYGGCVESLSCPERDGDWPCSQWLATSEAVRTLYQRIPDERRALLSRHESARVRLAFVPAHSVAFLASHLDLLEDTAGVVVARHREPAYLSTPGEAATLRLCWEVGTFRWSRWAQEDPEPLLEGVIRNARIDVAVLLVECLHRVRIESFPIELFDVVAARDEALVAAVYASPSIFAFRERRAVHARLLAARTDPRPLVRAAAVRGLAAFRAAERLPGATTAP